MSEPNGNGVSVAPWLAELGIGAGDYLTETKPRLKRAMKARCMSPAARVFCCLTLHTLSYQQELAVKMQSGKRVPLTPTDVAAETGMDKSNVRRALVELEAWGLAKTEGSVKGSVRLYSWAVPRKVDPDLVVARDNQIQLPTGFTPELWALCKHFRIRLPKDFVLAPDNQIEIERCARDYQNAQMVLRDALKRLSGSASPIRRKETERNIETNEPPPQPPEAPKSPPVRPSVSPAPPEKPIRENLRVFLTARSESFGLLVCLGDDILDEIASAIPNAEVLDRFTAQVRKQKPRASSWKVFIPIAQNVAAAWAAVEASIAAVKAEDAVRQRQRDGPAYVTYDEAIALDAADQERHPKPPGSEHGLPEAILRSKGAG